MDGTFCYLFAFEFFSSNVMLTQHDVFYSIYEVYQQVHRVLVWGESNAGTNVGTNGKC